MVPASLRLVWAEELERWLPHLRPSSVHIIYSKSNRLPGASEAQARLLRSYHLDEISEESGKVTLQGGTGRCNLRCPTSVRPALLIRLLPICHTLSHPAQPVVVLCKDAPLAETDAVLDNALELGVKGVPPRSANPTDTTPLYDAGLALSHATVGSNHLREPEPPISLRVSKVLCKVRLIIATALVKT